MAKEVKEVVVETVTPASAEKAMRKGTILQAVKAIAVLVVICLVCGALLALCNDIFFISDEERARREEAKINAALKEVYPDLINPQTLNINKDYSAVSTYGSVKKVVRSEDGVYIIAAEGIGGYGGSITVLVVIGADAKIINWQISDVGGETYANDVAQHTDWYKGEQISTDLELLKHSGATMTSTALNNAMKMASYYAMNVLNLGSNPQKDALDAIAGLVAGTQYADYEFTVNSDLTYRAALSDESNTMSYFFVGVKEGVSETLDAYVYNVETEPQVVILQGNLGFDARHEDTAVVVKSEGIANELVEKLQDLNYNEFKIRKFIEDFKLAQYVTISDAWDNTDGRINSVCIGTDGSYVVNVTGKQGFSGGTITLNVVIKDGYITMWNVESHESQSFLSDHILNQWNVVQNWFVGDSIDTKQTIVTEDAGEGKGTGATYTENAIARAVNYACEYVKTTTQQGGSN